MDKRWLGGVVLGVSLALLLASGVALAQGLVIVADKDCIECYPMEPDSVAPPDEYVVNLSAVGLSEQARYCGSLYQDGDQVLQPVCGSPSLLLATGSFFVSCDPPAYYVFTDVPSAGYFQGELQAYLGEWKVRVWEPGTDNSASVKWLVADDCTPEEVEFVPEPGTMALLASGLTGLAGYAGLRWRNGS